MGGGEHPTGADDAAAAKVAPVGAQRDLVRVGALARLRPADDLLVLGADDSATSWSFLVL